jgi:hypothetical protein
LAACAVVLVLWLPPLIDEWTRTPGNFSILADHFAFSPLPSVGFRRATDLVLKHLDASYFVLESFREPGLKQTLVQVTEPEALRGAACFGAWLVSAALAVKLGSRSLVALHAVVLVSLAVALLAISRITGEPWAYLMLGVWDIGVLLLVALVATLAVFLEKKVAFGIGVLRFGGLLGVAMIAVYSVRLVKRADQAGSMVPTYAGQLAVLVRGAAFAIEQSVGAASGHQGRYLVTWADVGGSGAQALGLLNELERRGYEVGMPAAFSWAVSEHRVLAAERATAQVHLATGAWLNDAQHIPGAVAVVFSDRLTAEERHEYNGLKERIAAGLRKLGHADAAARFDHDVGAALIPGLPTIYYLGLLRMGDLGPPAGVFIAPIRAP